MLAAIGMTALGGWLLWQGRRRGEGPTERETRKDQMRVDEAIAESFPASDPPSWTTGTDGETGER